MRVDDTKNFSSNSNFLLNKIVDDDIGWVSENTAILVVHGIGYQLPIETLDMFGRGLTRQYREVYGDRLQLKHEIVTKTEDGRKWFDNVLRICRKDSAYHIDIYEYYWARFTEDKSSWSDVNRWLQGVAKGAKKFYKRNAELGAAYKDKSIFFDKETGEFRGWLYRFFLTTVSKLLFLVDLLINLLIWLISLIPFIGSLTRKAVEGYRDSLFRNLTNLLADVTIYNVVDPKSKFFDTRIQIQTGAVHALQYLLEKAHKHKDKDCECDVSEAIRTHKKAIEFADDETKKKLEDELDRILNETELSYPSVIVAAHSLGTQISYDAINSINLRINKGEISTYGSDGKCKLAPHQPVSSQLKGFITFGSPLDKIVFFLRENTDDNAYLRQQFLDDYFGFKQRPVNSLYNNIATNKLFVKSDCRLERYLDKIQWRNYYDDKDYVSGGLDYYDDLTNINCQFKAGTFTFTHSYYWNSNNFYKDIITNFLT